MKLSNIVMALAVVVGSMFSVVGCASTDSVDCAIDALGLQAEDAASFHGGSGHASFGGGHASVGGRGFGGGRFGGIGGHYGGARLGSFYARSHNYGYGRGWGYGRGYGRGYGYGYGRGYGYAPAYYGPAWYRGYGYRGYRGYR
jgi:hypothetical protein